jgi:hypothetical protein
MDIKLKPWGLVPATSMGGWWCVCLCGGWVPCGIEAQREVQRSLGPRRTGNDRPGQELQLPHLLAVATRCRRRCRLPRCCCCCYVYHLLRRCCRRVAAWLPPMPPGACEGRQQRACCPAAGPAGAPRGAWQPHPPSTSSDTTSPPAARGSPAAPAGLQESNHCSQAHPASLRIAAPTACLPHACQWPTGSCLIFAGGVGRV